jgi:hypothetical protein
LSLSPEAYGGSIFLKSLHGYLVSIWNLFSQLVNFFGQPNRKNEAAFVMFSSFFSRFLASQSSKIRVSVKMLSGNFDAPYITQRIIIIFQIEAVFKICHLQI